METRPLAVLQDVGLRDAPRNTLRPVLLIGFQRHSNLGIGYLASTLQHYGYAVVILDFEADRSEILKAAESLIQY